MPEYNPPTFRTGDVLRASDLQAIADAARAQRVQGGAGVEVRRGPGGSVQITGNLPPGKYIGVASGNITARSGTTPGTGTVTVKYVAASGSLASVGADIAVKNCSSTTMTSGNGIDSGQYCSIWRDAFGVWWVSPEECS